MAGLQLEGGCQHDPGLRLEAAVAIGEVQFPGFQLEGRCGIGRVQQPHRVQPFGRAAALSARIHHHRAPHGAWDAHGPLQPAQAKPGCFTGQGGDRFSGFRFHQAAGGVEPAPLQPPVADGEAGQAAIGDQQVGACADAAQGQALGLGPGRQRNQLIDLSRLGKPLRWTSHLPGGERLKPYPLA